LWHCNVENSSAVAQEVSMNEHILLKRATRKPYRRTPEMPSSAEYDSARGYWLVDGQPMASTPQFRSGPPTSKKCDQETGEDMKGE
jgi:hypothetical protein